MPQFNDYDAVATLDGDELVLVEQDSRTRRALVSDILAYALTAFDASDVTFTPAGTIAAGNVQDAIEEVATEAAAALTAGLAAKANLAGAAFTGALSITTGATNTPLVITYSDDGAGAGPQIDLGRDSASPAASDYIGAVRFLGRDSGGNFTTYTNIRGYIADATDGSEDGVLDFVTVVAGSPASRVLIGGGIYSSGVTGGDKGAGSANFSALYENNARVAVLTGANFSGTVTVNGVQNPMAFGYAVDSAQAMDIVFTRTSATPAASDQIVRFVGYGNDSGGNLEAYHVLAAMIVDPTNGSEDSRWQFWTMAAGSLGVRMNVEAGVYHSSATGGDKGNNTINFGAVYDDNVLLTCMAMAETFAEKGTFTDEDVAEWDARVPDQIEPARKEQKPVMEKAIVSKLVRDDDGSMRAVPIEAERQKVEQIPVYAADGKTGIDMIEEPVFEEVDIPEKVIPRQHHAARVFKALIDGGFDPRDPAAYIAKMRADEALPGMPTKADWEHNALSSGEMVSRLWLATEMLALTVATIEERTR